MASQILLSSLEKIVNGVTNIFNNKVLTDETSKLICDGLKAFVNKNFKIILSNETGEYDFIIGVFPDGVEDLAKNIRGLTTPKFFDMWSLQENWTIEIPLSTAGMEKVSPLEYALIIIHYVSMTVSSHIKSIQIYNKFNEGLYMMSMGHADALQKDPFNSFLKLLITTECVQLTHRDESFFIGEVKQSPLIRILEKQDNLIFGLTKLVPPNGINPKASYYSFDFIVSSLLKSEHGDWKSLENDFTYALFKNKSKVINDILLEQVSKIFNSKDDWRGLRKEYVQESIRKCKEDVIMEFVLFKKHLKKIDQSEIDYITLQIDSIRTNDDKIMLMSYLYSKLNMVEFYLEVLDSPKETKKYEIPQSREQLQMFRDKLVKLRETIFNYKLPMKNDKILVSWPTGYEG